MIRLIVALQLLLLLGVVGSATAQTRPADTSGQAASKFLYPGDRIKLEIWREPDLSGEFEVDETGTVVLPKLGATPVSQLSPPALKALLVERYSTYLRNPSIGVTVLHRVSVLGAVHNPGIYSVSPTMTLGDVVALAGGASSDGKSDRFELIRGGEKLTVVRGQATRVDSTPIRSGDQIMIPLKGWASRNPGVLAGTLTAVAGIVVTLLAR
jgi:polysaccharide export outer membrane protein